MNSASSDKSCSMSTDSHVSPKNSKWLEENLEEVNQSVKAMLKLIEGEGESFENKAGMHYEMRLKLAAQLEGFHRMYRSLAEHYDRLTRETNKNIILHPGSVQDSYMVTPDPKLGHRKFGQLAVGSDLYLSSGGASSDLSLKEGSESSASVSDSESELFHSSLNKQLSPYVSSDGKELCQKLIEGEIEFPNMKEKLEVTKKEDVDNTYATLLKRVTEYEEELKKSNEKLLLSEQEVERLQRKLSNNETVNEVVGNLQAQLESAQRDIMLKESDLVAEKGRVLELQNQVVELETQLSGSDCKIWALTEELDVAREKIKASEDDMEIAQTDATLLEITLNSEKKQVLELQEKIARHIADASDRNLVIDNLNIALSDARRAFSSEKEKLQYDISALSEQVALLGAEIEESEKQRKSLENEIRQCEADKQAMELLHEEQQIVLCVEIEILKEDIAERGKLVETLNKRIDTLNLEYDMLMAEKDSMTANEHELVAEVNSHNNHIQQLEEHLCRLRIEHVELTSRSEGSHKLVESLRLKVKELETEVDEWRTLILERDEEKREAIRQLCFSLEHYRNRYQELRRAFPGCKRSAN